MGYSPITILKKQIFCQAVGRLKIGHHNRWDAAKTYTKPKRYNIGKAQKRHGYLRHVFAHLATLSICWPASGAPWYWEARHKKHMIDVGNLGFKKPCWVWANDLLQFHDSPQKCSQEVHRSVRTHDKIIIMRSGVFVQGNTVPRISNRCSWRCINV